MASSTCPTKRPHGEPYKSSCTTKWVSYAKAPFEGAEAVYQYLGRYTHRVGLSNQRLVSATDDTVTFRTRGQQTASLHPHEFLRRFLQHVLPDGFVKLRHYGLLAPGNVNTKLVTARRLLEAKVAPAWVVPTPPNAEPATVEQLATWRELLLQLTGIDVTRCQQCGSSNLIHRPLPRGNSPPRDTS